MALAVNVKQPCEFTMSAEAGRGDEKLGGSGSSRNSLLLRLALFIGCVVFVEVMVGRNPGFSTAANERGNQVFLPMVHRSVVDNLAPIDVPIPTLTCTPFASQTVVSGPTSSPTPANTSTPTPTSTPLPLPTLTPTLVPLGSGSRLGVWIGNGNADTVNVLMGTGAKWTRVMVNWAHIEYGDSDPPSYDFGYYDELFGALGAAGITTIAEIRNNPWWVADTNCGPINGPGGMDSYTRFLAAMVQRYKGPPYNIKQWEFYNEPDNIEHWQGGYLGCWGDHTGEYVEMLRAASTTIKGVDPEAMIILGGLAYENPPPYFNMRFLDEVFAAGGAQFLDVINVHYFSSQNPTWSSYGKDIGGKVQAVRQIMARHGVSKPVAVTESSWTTSPHNAPDLPEKQAQYVAKLLARSLAIDLYTVLWFPLADWAGADYPYGLVDQRLQPKPAYQAFQVATTEFGEARSVRLLLPEEVGAEGGIEGYAFDVAGQVRWVLWADGVSEVEVLLPAGASEAKDKMGRSIFLREDGSSTSITLTESPVFVRMP